MKKLWGRRNILRDIRYHLLMPRGWTMYNEPDWEPQRHWFENHWEKQLFAYYTYKFLYFEIMNKYKDMLFDLTLFIIVLLLLAWAQWIHRKNFSISKLKALCVVKFKIILYTVLFFLLKIFYDSILLLFFVQD